MPRSSSACPTSALGPRCVKAEKPGIFKHSATCPDVRKPCSDRSESLNFLYVFTQPGPKAEVHSGGWYNSARIDGPLYLTSCHWSDVWNAACVSRSYSRTWARNASGRAAVTGRGLYEVPLTNASSAMFSCVAPWDTVLFCFPFATQGFAACSAVR
jgi:hypothetical protein